jgi:hypothetical protein
LTVASLLPDRDDWLTLRTVRLRYAIDAGLFRLYDAGGDGEATARVSVAAAAKRFADFCVQRIVRYAAQGQVPALEGTRGR